MTMESATLHIPAIHCDGCLKTVRKTVEDAGGAWEAGDAGSKRVTVRFDPARLTREQLAQALEKAGFPPAEEA